MLLLSFTNFIDKHNRVSQAKLSPVAVAICDIYIVRRSVIHQRFFM